MYILAFLTPCHHTLADKPVSQNVTIITSFRTSSNSLFTITFVVSVLVAEACNTDTTPTQPHRNSNTHRTKNNKTNVVIQQHSRKLLMMDILMSETC